MSNETIKLPTTFHWWCYGCDNVLSACDYSEELPCHNCRGRTANPYYEWDMKGLIENGKYCIRCIHFDRDEKFCTKHEGIIQLDYPNPRLAACDDWKFDYMYWNVGSKASGGTQ